MMINLPELCALMGLLVVVLSLVFSWAFRIERRLAGIESKLDRFCKSEK